MFIEELEQGRLVKVPALDGDEPDARLVRVEEVVPERETEGGPIVLVMVHGHFEGTATRTGFRRPVGTEVQVML